MIADVLPWLCGAGLFAWILGAWVRHAWRSPAYRPHAVPAPALADEDTVPIPLPTGPDPVDTHAATTPTGSACLCAATCHARPCLTYTKEHAYPMNLVFLDTETSGLNPQRCEIWEIGAIVRAKGRDVEYAWQIRPDLADAEPTGLRIGRYYQRSLVTRAQPGEAWKLVHPNHEGDSEREPLRWTNVNMLAAELAEILDGAYLIGAVPWFDERFLQRFLSNNGQAATNHYHLIDVETLAAGALRWNPPWDFDKILNAYDLRYDEAERHTALGDARMARDLYDAVIEGTR